MRPESVGSVILFGAGDPPFNSAQNYNVLCTEQDESRSAARIRMSADVVVPVDQIGPLTANPPPSIFSKSDNGGPMSTTTDPARLLPEEMLARFDQRAAGYDRDNTFFQEDWDELRQSGYLLAAVPSDMGGAGLGLDEVSRLQSRLAYRAAPTALAVNMHLYWTGVAADLLRTGDESCRWILEKAAEGEVFAAIHGEAGSDIPLLLSTTTAKRVEGGWRLTGHKLFGSLSPVWTYAGFHAMDTSDPSSPRIIHGFVPRSSPGLQIVETWDTLGMRATQSHDTVLEDVFVPDELCPRLPGRIRRRRPLPGRNLRVGTARLRRRLPWRRPAGLRHHPRLEQIFRDVRMGRFHPGNTLLAHELVGKLCLGINPDDPQRWG
ncbi:MAG: acyl-CoA dehydrogenase family protein [Gemmatimonadaceae bacterium]